MKKIILGLLLPVFLITGVFAYTPTAKDLKVVKILEVLVDKMSEKKVKVLKAVIPMVLQKEDKDTRNYFMISSLQKIIEKKPLNLKDFENNGKDSENNGNYNGSIQSGNYVWGGAMNLAWNELVENFTHEKVKLSLQDTKAIEMQRKFNDPVMTKKDLDKESYYVKSGLGNKTVKLINKESREKFPQKSFEDLKEILRPEDFISYAYFFKKVNYQNIFNSGNVNFLGKKYKGFYAKGGKQKEQIKILNYENDDKFIIKILLKDENDEIFLAKGYDMESPKNVVKEINNKNGENLESLGKNYNYIDSFGMPNLELDIKRDYKEFIKKRFLNKLCEKYYIAKMFENIKFKMNREGAKVENEAVIIATKTAMPMDLIRRNFNFDKSFRVVMKRKSSSNPYFILGINNDSFMSKAD